MPVSWYERTDGARPRGGRRWHFPWVVPAALLVLVLAHRWTLPLAARALIVDEAPSKADAILVLGGGDGSRQERAIALYDAGWAPQLVSSGDRLQLPGVDQTFAELGAEYLVARGVPQQAIRLLSDTTSTYDDAVASLALCREGGFSALLVVTDSFHMRRATLTFRHVYRRSGIHLTFVAARPSWFDPKSWWTEERAFLAVCGEYAKLVLYLFKGYTV